MNKNEFRLLLIVSISDTFARCSGDHVVADSELNFCQTNLTNSQLLVDVRWENNGCLLRCDTVDLAFPQGAKLRYPVSWDRLSLPTQCGAVPYDGWWCFHGKCVELNREGELAKHWTPTPFEPCLLSQFEII